MISHPFFPVWSRCRPGDLYDSRMNPLGYPEMIIAWFGLPNI